MILVVEILRAGSRHRAGSNATAPKNLLRCCKAGMGLISIDLHALAERQPSLACAKDTKLRIS